MLGDLTTDDYGFRTLKENYLQKFKNNFIDKLGYPCYALPGNHDSHPVNVWNEQLGVDYGRQYSVKIGDAVFIMLDTFAVTGTNSDNVKSAVADSEGNSIDASGANYSGIDMEWLKKELANYPTETIFLCSHKYNSSDSNATEFTELLNANPRIVCMFEGHTHKYNVSSLAGSAKLINVGTYSYKPAEDNGWLPTTKNDFEVFDENYAWGYQVLEWNDTEVRTYHVRIGRTYTGKNTSTDGQWYEGIVEKVTTFKINK